MLQARENETEILLGNKQLLGIFFIVAIFLGIAFTGGYMVGKGSPAGKVTAGSVRPAGTAAPANSSPAGGETHSVPADSSTDTRPATTAPTGTEEPPLGSPQRKAFEQGRPRQATPAPGLNSADAFMPEAGQTFLQVAAVERDEAVAVADVLHKKGFRAHAVPLLGNGKIYRVLIGPIADAADLSSTRDSLRKTGFREVIVRKY